MNLSKLSKNAWFTIFLLTFALIEFFILLYDVLHPFRNEFELASYETDVSERQVMAEPFSFESWFSDYFTFMSDNIAKSLLSTAVPTIYKKNREILMAQGEDTARKIVQMEIESEADSVAKLDTADAKIAIVIDDVGISPTHTKEIMALKLPITMSFLTYGHADKETALEAIKEGYEVMLHVPMMPHVKKDLAPITLSSEMSEEEVRENLDKMLERYQEINIKGINNHMGSLYTEDEKAMDILMKILAEKGLFFLDSKTTAKSAAKWAAYDHEVKYIARDVFLDNENDYDYVMEQLRKTQQIAAKKGYAVAIGHPKTKTFEAIKDWAATLDKGYYRLVFISELIP